MHNTPDNILLNRIKEGNKFAFDTLFFKYYKPLYRFAFNFCGSATIAEESVQNTFVKIWKGNNELNPENEIGKLLFIYTKNEIIDEIRKQNTRKKYESSVIQDSILEEDSKVRDQNIVKALIESAIEQLPKKAKEIFRLAKQEGLTNMEIAEYLNISKKTVENQLTIAFKKMRQYLEPFKNQLIF